MRKLLLSSTLALAVAVSALAESKTVTVTEAGTLQGKFTDEELATVTELTVSGSVNKTDLSFINSSLTALETLNLQDANIVEETVETTLYPANEIPDNTFDSNKTIVSIKFPSTLTRIGKEAFQFSTLQYADFSTCPQLKTIDGYAFYCTAYLREIDLSGLSLLEIIGEYAFNTSAEKINELDIPTLKIDLSGCQSLQTIDDYAFSNAYKAGGAIVDFTGCKSLSYVGNRAFNNVKLETVDFGSCSALETLTGYAFNLCSKITTVILPANLKTIPASTFGSASNLATVKSYAVTPPALEAKGFSASGVPKATLYVPTGTKESYAADEEWAKFASIEEDASLAIEKVSTGKFVVSVQNGTLIIRHLPIGSEVQVYNIAGALVSTAVATAESVEIALPAPGIYIVKNGKHTAKVVL